MIKYILDRRGLDEYLQFSTSNEFAQDTQLEEMIHGSIYYTCEVHSNTYFLAKNLHQRLNRGQDIKELLNSAFLYSSERNFYLEEFNVSFMNFILKHISNKSIEFDVQIIQMQEDYINRNYGKQICY